MNQEQTNITTGKQIRHLRTQLGMTQEELAGELNVTRQALSNWERMPISTMPTTISSSMR